MNNLTEEFTQLAAALIEQRENLKKEEQYLNTQKIEKETNAILGELRFAKPNTCGIALVKRSLHSKLVDSVVQRLMDILPLEKFRIISTTHEISVYLV